MYYRHQHQHDYHDKAAAAEAAVSVAVTCYRIGRPWDLLPRELTCAHLMSLGFPPV
jgi:hypothetical protein